MGYSAMRTQAVLHAVKPSAKGYPAMGTFSYQRCKIEKIALSIANMSNSEQKSKRKATSPCTSEKVKVQLNNSDREVTFKVNMPSSTDEVKVDVVTIRIVSRNGEKFLGGLSRPQAFSIWEKCLNLPGALVSGIALTQTTDKPFLIVFHLHDDIDLNDVKSQFTILIDEAEFVGEKVIPRPPPAKLGEEVTIMIPKTKFAIRPFQADQWICRFGVVVKKAIYKEADDLKGITTDDIEVVAKLRKHIPGILPAFGRKMMVRYSGQPIVCGTCFQPGHLRKECTNERVEWAKYVKVFISEDVAPIELLGDWKRLLN